MCGRFTMHHTTDQIADRFGIQQNLFELPERYNIAPQQEIGAVVVESFRPDDPEGERALEGFRWGLVPFWAKDPSVGNRMINARAETVAEKPAFRRLLARRRCLIPSDGFYEWDKEGGTRQPFHFRLRDGGLFGFAGLWDEWESPDGSPLRTCTILTTAANELVGRVHDRMPVILPRGDAEDHWLDPSVQAADDLLPLLRPYPERDMVAVAVSRRVNTPANDDPSLLAPALAAGPAA